MRFMVLVPGSPESEAGEMPSTEALGAMTKYNEELVKSGVMLAGEGLHPTSRGAKVRVARRGDRVAQASTVRRQCRDRAAPDLRGRRLRRAADAGAARGQRAAARAERPELGA